MTDQTPKVQINIDGKDLEVPQGCMIIEAADNAGFRIPRFCYHKKLSIAANCRMCLVDVEGARRPAPACATPVTAGMKVLTKSPKALEYQKSVMEFLLINHPLDCPICDQGGECELQDNAMGYGKDVSRYNEGKRVVKDPDIGPLISTDLTRCIHCSRCVRFGAEIAGMKELGMTGRGEHSMINTFLEKSVDSEMSGNVIDLCPVGALTSKPFRYKARAWELQQFASVAPHDCVGSNIYLHARRAELMRVVPKENEAINEVWISDRDRFSYEGIKSPDRATVPMIKKNGSWEVVDWNEALEFAANHLKHVKGRHGSEAIGAIAGSHSTCEEYALLNKLLRGLGSHNLDHRIRNTDFRHQDWQAAFPGLEFPLAAIEEADSILFVGGNVRKEQPIVHHRMRKASLQTGAKIVIVNPADFDLKFDIAVNTLVNTDDMVLELAGIVKAVAAAKGASLPAKLGSLLNNAAISASAQAAADVLANSKSAVLMLGEIAGSHPQAALMYTLMQVLKELSNARFGQLTPGANTAGAWLTGILPHRGVAGEAVTLAGKNASEMLDPGQALAAYVLLNFDPALDTVYGPRAMAALAQAECVIALSPYITESLKHTAHVILPIASFAETSGTYVNAMGDWQSFTATANPCGEARPAWKVLRVLANFLNLFKFDYVSSEEILNELKRAVRGMKPITATWDVPGNLPPAQTEIKRLGMMPMYASDNIVRRAKSLQQTLDAKAMRFVEVSPYLAERLKLSEAAMTSVEQDAEVINLPLKINPSLARYSVIVPIGLAETAGLGEAFAPITVKQVRN